MFQPRKWDFAKHAQPQPKKVCAYKKKSLSGYDEIHEETYEEAKRNEETHLKTSFALNGMIATCFVIILPGERRMKKQRKMKRNEETHLKTSFAFYGIIGCFVVISPGVGQIHKWSHRGFQWRWTGSIQAVFHARLSGKLRREIGNCLARHSWENKCDEGCSSRYEKHNENAAQITTTL